VIFEIFGIFENFGFLTFEMIFQVLMIFVMSSYMRSSRSSRRFLTPKKKISENLQKLPYILAEILFWLLEGEAFPQLKSEYKLL